MKSFCTLFILTLLACNIGRQGVYIAEMATRPMVILKDNFLIIKTANSLNNSAQSLYKIKILPDIHKKSIFISADQAASKAAQNSFTINLTYYNVKTPTAFSYFWLDPDKQTTKLDLAH